MGTVEQKMLKRNIELIIDEVVWRKMDKKTYTENEVVKLLDFVFDEVNKLVDEL